jgi:hypothetical protein
VVPLGLYVPRLEHVHPGDFGNVFQRAADHDLWPDNPLCRLAADDVDGIGQLVVDVYNGRIGVMVWADVVDA